MKSVKDRILKAITVTASGCWEVGTNGWYHKLIVNGKRVYYHRAAWSEFVGEIPDGMGVLHRCDNPPCCNPEHLFLGTQKHNMIDCANKSRHVGRTKLKKELHAEVLRKKESGFSVIDLSREYNVSTKTIHRAVRKARNHQMSLLLVGKDLGKTKPKSK